MIVVQIVRHSYTIAWNNVVRSAKERGVRLSPTIRIVGENYAEIITYFSFDKVQDYIDASIRKSRSPMAESEKHREQLKLLARRFARVLFALLLKNSKQINPFEPGVFYVSAIEILKQHYIGCGIYPCYDPNSNPARRIKGSPLPISGLSDVDLGSLESEMNEPA